MLCLYRLDDWCRQPASFPRTNSRVHKDGSRSTPLPCHSGRNVPHSLLRSAVHQMMDVLWCYRATKPNFFFRVTTACICQVQRTPSFTAAWSAGRTWMMVWMQMNIWCHSTASSVAQAPPTHRCFTPQYVPPFWKCNQKLWIPISHKLIEKNCE